MEDVVELMLSNWHMNSPVPASLVITVVGGAKNFKLDGKKREVFNRGLVNVSCHRNLFYTNLSNKA